MKTNHLNQKRGKQMKKCDFRLKKKDLKVKTIDLVKKKQRLLFVIISIFLLHQACLESYNSNKLMKKVPSSGKKYIPWIWRFQVLLVSFEKDKCKYL